LIDKSLFNVLTRYESMDKTGKESYELQVLLEVVMKGRGMENI